MESPGPGGLASLGLMTLGTPKPVCAPSRMQSPHQDTRGSGLQWAPWGLACELGTRQAEVDPPELQAQKAPRGGPLAGQHGGQKHPFLVGVNPKSGGLQAPPELMP